MEGDAMHDEKATTRRPPPQRQAGSLAGDSVPLDRAERLLKVREVARMLCVSPPTVYSMIRRGELRALYVRWMVRLRRREVETYISMHREWVQKQRRKYLRRMAK